MDEMTTSTSTQTGSEAQAPSRPPQGGGQFTGKRQLRNFLLDRMQVRYTAIIVLVSACLTAGLGYYVMRYAREASKTVEITVKTSVDDPEMQKQVMDSLYARDRVLLVTIIGFGALLSIILAAYGIVITHKVAGPIYKIASYFDKVRDGRLGAVYNLRKGDQLQDFFEHFRAMHESLRQRTQEDIEALAAAIAALEASGAGAAAGAQLEALRALKRKKEESLA
jgi:hypothetical protein